LNLQTYGAPDDLLGPPHESEYHGTHVAGIAAAARDGRGMHGVAYDAHILPFRLLGPSSRADGEAIAYASAADHGAKVLNGSYGPTTTPRPKIQDLVTGAWEVNPHYRVMDYQV